MRYLVFLIGLLASPVYALEICDEAWFTRNQIFDRAGYCFGSPLGEAVFDNADCTTKSPNLTEADKSAITIIREIEEEFECKIDTSRQSLVIELFSLKRSLIDIPIPTGYESGCLGWLGAPKPLFAGRAAAYPVTAQILPGDHVNWQHLDAGDWGFVTVFRNQQVIGAGWGMFDFNTMQCKSFAG